MRIILACVLIIVTALGATAQSNIEEITYDNFEIRMLDYTPVKRPTVTQEKFEWAIYVLSQTKQELNNELQNYNVVLYLNIFSAFNALQVDNRILEIAMRKFAESDGSCEYLINYKKQLHFDERLPELYNFYFENCLQKASLETKPTFNLEEYIKANAYDAKLVRMIYNIYIDDEKYRVGTDTKTFQELQPAFDFKNQMRIDSLYKKYGTYIGRSLVGKKFESTMWSVIQHSNPALMEKYLPIVHKAVMEEELPVTPLKMLLDRLYALKFGYQIFGTQGGGLGVKMADEKIRIEVIEKYNIE